MSRIGNTPIVIPAGVTFENNNGEVKVTGKLGTLTRTIDNRITTRVEENTIYVENTKSNKDLKAKHGLYRQLINNMVVGVSEGYEKKLKVNGVGYRVIQDGAGLTLNIGFSHPVKVSAVDGIELTTDKNIITVKGIDKEAVGQKAAKIRDIKPVEPYHAYGISYSDEVVVRKVVKSGKK